jgi:hypothetical protein
LLDRLILLVPSCYWPWPISVVVRIRLGHVIWDVVAVVVVIFVAIVVSIVVILLVILVMIKLRVLLMTVVLIHIEKWGGSKATFAIIWSTSRGSSSKVTRVIADLALTPCPLSILTII